VRTAWRKKEGDDDSRAGPKREREREREGGRILRKNPCHCLRRRQKIFEDVNSFYGATLRALFLPPDSTAGDHSVDLEIHLRK